MGDEEAGHPNPHTQDRNIIQNFRLLFSILQVIVCVGFLAILLGTSVRLRHQVIWILELWKWCVLMLVIVGGWILLGIMMEGVFFLTEKIFACFINVKYSYYIYGTKNHIRVLLWFISIYIPWKLLMVRGGAKDNYYSSHDSKILSWITSCLRALLIGIALWVLRIFFVNLLTSSFLVPNRLFPKIWKSLIDHHILYLITSSKGKSGDPVKKIPKWIVKMIMEPQNKELLAESLTVWQMRRIIEIIKICPHEFSAQNTNEIVDDLYSKIEDKAAEKLELEAKDKREIEPKAAERSDQLEAKDKSDDGDNLGSNPMTCGWGSCFSLSNSSSQVPKKKISDDEDKLLSKCLKIIFDNELGEFMVTNISGGVNPKSIGIASLRKWLVIAAMNRNSLSASFRDSEKAKEDLNIVISLTVVIIWLILIGLLTTQVLIVILTQCAALAFMFGDTAKKVFEGIVFVFVAHPFDVGDLCLVQNEKMVVKRISLLMTEFQKNCNDLVVYPNLALSSLNITILQEDARKLRDDFIHDSVKISIDRSTPEEKLQDLHEKIVRFSREPHWIDINTDLESFEGPNGEQLWFKPKNKFVFKEIEDGKLNLVLDIHYRKLDFEQDNYVKSYVRDALVKKLKRLFDDLKINYHSIQIQEVDGEAVK